MRILQIIDSLAAGGAERMAVNYANALQSRVAYSGLVVTRRDGPLKQALSAEVEVLLLDKTRKLDVGAMMRLRKFCRTRKIDVVHAHGTSFFTGFLLKLLLPKIRLVWHDHFGHRDKQTLRQNAVLWLCARFFWGVIAVNRDLECWIQEKLGLKTCIYLPNFTALDDKPPPVQMHEKAGKRILYVANLRNPKNHLLVVRVASALKNTHPDWSFHFVGEDRADEYASKLKSAIAAEGLPNVYIYGQQQHVSSCIAQSDICIIASDSEGLPVALVEYGMHRKAVVCTNVGEMPRMVKNGTSGFVVKAADVVAFETALKTLIDNPEMRVAFGKQLYLKIQSEHAEEAVMNRYLEWLPQGEKNALYV